MAEEYRITRRIEETAKEIGSKLSDVAKHVEEKAPQLARGIAMLSTSSLVVAVPAVLITQLFPQALPVASALLPIIIFVIQLSISIMILSLTVGVARRII